MRARVLMAFLAAFAVAPLTAHAAGETSVTETKSKTAWSSEALDKKYGKLAPEYTAAVTLAKLGQYQEAIALLKSLGKEKDPRVLNYLGFTHRKMGKVDEALPYYEKALKIEPDFTLARSYLGEAYLQLGKLDKAKAELAKIKSVCGTGCDEYQKLEDAIKTHEAKS